MKCHSDPALREKNLLFFATAPRSASGLAPVSAKADDIRLQGFTPGSWVLSRHLSQRLGTQLNGPQPVFRTSHDPQSKSLRLSPPPVMRSEEMKSTSNRSSIGHIFVFPSGRGQGRRMRDVPIHLVPLRRQSLRMYAPCLAASGGMFDHSAVKRSPSICTRYSLPVVADFQI
jgi:hypothetical protein